LIGGGGFSLVYLAYHIPTKARAVIKEYFPEDQVKRIPGGRLVPVSEDKLPAINAGIRRFLSEASALSKVNHPNIVRTSNLFRANDTIYMVMNYEEGRDLRYYVKKFHNRLDEKFMRTIFPPLLQGLQAFHDQQLLHLDIKPANILIKHTGVPILIDFGGVQQFRPGQPALHSQTLTLGFAPIEQHEHGYLGPWSDIYAVGATIYSCMTGRAPPPAPQRKKKDSLGSINPLFSRYSKRLLRGVDRALAMDYRKRPQSATELLELCFGDVAGPGAEQEQSIGLFSGLRQRLQGDRD
jgi:serine/threonine protein kinase